MHTNPFTVSKDAVATAKKKPVTIQLSEAELADLEARCKAAGGMSKAAFVKAGYQYAIETQDAAAAEAAATEAKGAKGGKSTKA
jgi:hypothetical protein